MKYLKIKLLKNSTTNEIVYPTDYQNKIGNRNQLSSGLYFTDKGQDYLLLVVDDAFDVNSIVEKDRITVLTLTEAKAISEANETRTEEITDTARVERLKLKASLGETLTTEEKNALDPNNPEPGFGKKKIFADLFQELEDANK